MNKYFYCLLLGLFAGLTNPLNAQTTGLQGAAQAPFGNGKYKDQIYWINWDTDNNGYPGETISNNSNQVVPRSVQVPGGITYTITYTSKSTPTVVSYVPGWWDWDDLPSGYNWFKTGVTPYNFRYYTDNTSTQAPNSLKYNYSTNYANFYNSLADAHHSVIGLKNQGEGNNVSFNIKISGVYTATGLPVDPSLLKGFVFAGAESLRGVAPASFNTSSSEFYSLNNISSSPQPWRVIDTVFNKVPSGWTHYGAYSWAGRYTTGFTEAANVTNNGAKIQLFNSSAAAPPPLPTSPSNPNPTANPGNYYEGPGDVVWMADGSTNVDVEFRGNGYSAIAVGFIYAADMGDAPQTYGSEVTNILEVGFTGGNLSDGNNQAIASVALATRATPNLRIGVLVDGDSKQPYSALAKGDDTTLLADEDGLSAPGAVVNFVPNSTAQSITVPVVNSSNANATLMGWIDINNNGSFEPNELAQATILANTNSTLANLSWNLPQPFLQNTNYILRLRLFDVNNTNAVDNVGTTHDDRATLNYIFGETEDHLVRLNTPLSVTLLNFTGNLQNCEAKLQWTSAKEADFNYYELERSENGKSFEAISRIAAKGNNSTYDYTDNKKAFGTNFYRLKMVNNDGTIDYSTIVMLKSKCHESIFIAPNFTKNQTFVNGLTAGQTIQIFNMNGQLLTTVKANDSKAVINLSNYSSGTYKIVILENDKIIYTQSVVKD